MGNKPPAFQFYAKDWRSSPTIRSMNDHEKAVFIDMLAAAWDSSEPGTLPLPIELAAKVCGRNVRSLVKLLSKFPQTFVEVSGKLVNQKLFDQALNYREISSKRSQAAFKSHANAQQLHHTASATASAKSNTTPLPPAVAGDIQLIRWMNETIEVHMGRHRRMPNLEAYQGAMPYVVVEELTRMGYPARIVREQ